MLFGSVNKAIIIGNVGQDPTINETNSGLKVCKFSVATTESWKDKNTNERKTKTDWHNIVIFNSGLVQIASDYVKKGIKVYIEGSIVNRKWTDQSGVEKNITEIVVSNHSGSISILTPKGDNSFSHSPISSNNSHDNIGAGNGMSNSINGITDDFEDDEIPFN